MIELDLTDGRVLSFASDSGRAAARGIAALSESAISRIRHGDHSGTRRSRSKFLISSPSQPLSAVAVLLKTGVATSFDDPGRGWQFGLQRQELLEAYRTNIPFQAWLLSRNARSLRVWDVDLDGSPGTQRAYHLCEVFSRSSEANDVILAGHFPLDTHHLARCADDWEKRLRLLYGCIASWCRAIGPDLIADEERTVTLNEDLMKRYAVAARKLPMFRVRSSSHVVLTFKPYGLWVDGANGRIDVRARNGKHLVVDRASAFQPPRWEMFAAESASSQKEQLAEGLEFNEEAFGTLLRG